MEAFLEIRLYPDLRGHPHPHGGPQYQQAQELFLGDTLLKASCYVCYELSFEFFLDPLGIWVGLWDYPHPHGGPQHLQGQGLILEHTS